MIPIGLDNIIFSLQQSGGVSVVWKQHLERLICDPNFQCDFIEYDTAELNFFRKQLLINKDLIELKSASYLPLSRYLNLNSKFEDKHIFHSSYYRVENAINAINVTTVHDFTYEHFRTGMAKKIHSWQKNNAINNSQGIICVSESTKKDLLCFLPHLNKDKIRVIYNGVDAAFNVLNKEYVFDKRHYFENYSYILYIGDRRSEYKNFKLAVEASALAKKALLIIGGGGLTEKELGDLNIKLGESNFKIILGVSTEELNYYYSRAFCLLYPSLYEGFGIPVVEAQKCGCPVITTTSSSIPEVIGNSYFSIENPSPQSIVAKIKELSSNYRLREETIEMGIDKAKEFSWQKTYEQTIEFYNELYKL